MPELRKDPISGRWVIVAEDRAARPNAFRDMPEPVASDDCPFCVGRESGTPGEILACRDPGSNRDDVGWRVRLIPNKYPALTATGRLDSPSDGFHEGLDGIGAHEVLIESSEHVRSITEVPDLHVRESFRLCRARIQELKEDPRLVYALVFKNVDTAAGASIEHTHSQLIATPIVPIAVAEELAGARTYHDEHDSCLFCDLIERELTDGTRVVLDSPEFAVICPYASRFPFETWILPKSHSSHFESIRSADVDALADTVKQAIGRIEAVLSSPAYNYLIHTAPLDREAMDHYHWHVEIIPRVSNVAGFEWGTGVYINPIPPEKAAAALRNVERFGEVGTPEPTGFGARS